MFNPRSAFERRLNLLIPQQEDEIMRKRLIGEFVSTFADEDIYDILTRKKPLYYENGSEAIYLP